LDGSGRIRYTEFIAATIEAQGDISEERLAEAFDRFDTDDSGNICVDDLAEILGKDFHDMKFKILLVMRSMTICSSESESECSREWRKRRKQ